MSLINIRISANDNSRSNISKYSENMHNRNLPFLTFLNKLHICKTSVFINRNDNSAPTTARVASIIVLLPSRFPRREHVEQVRVSAAPRVRGFSEAEPRRTVKFAIKFLLRSLSSLLEVLEELGRSLGISQHGDDFDVDWDNFEVHFCRGLSFTDYVCMGLVLRNHMHGIYCVQRNWFCCLSKMAIFHFFIEIFRFLNS